MTASRASATAAINAQRPAGPGWNFRETPTSELLFIK
jgi:hypothetical protein